MMYFIFRIVQEEDTHNAVPKIRQLKSSTAFASPHRCSRNNFETSKPTTMLVGAFEHDPRDESHQLFHYHSLGEHCEESLPSGHPSLNIDMDSLHIQHQSEGRSLQFEPTNGCPLWNPQLRSHYSSPHRLPLHLPFYQYPYILQAA